MLDLIAAILLLAGSFFCFSAAVGIVRFPDVMTRLHAVTKPQVFGLILISAAVALSLRSWPVTALLLLVIIFQIVTAPASAHMVSRTAYRTGLWNTKEAVIDQLADDLAEAGFQRPDSSPHSDEGKAPEDH